MDFNAGCYTIFITKASWQERTPKLNVIIVDAFVTKFGSYDGWAQKVVFIGRRPLKNSWQRVAEVTSDNVTPKHIKRKRGSNHNHFENK